MTLDAFKTNGSSPPERVPDFQLIRQSTISLCWSRSPTRLVSGPRNISQPAPHASGQPSWSSTAAWRPS